MLFTPFMLKYIKYMNMSQIACLASKFLQISPTELILLFACTSLLSFSISSLWVYFMHPIDTPASSLDSHSLCEKTKTELETSIDVLTAQLKLQCNKLNMVGMNHRTI